MTQAAAPGTNDPLAQLRDIHLPAPVDWWPPAPGWWLLAALLLVLLGAALAWAVRRHRRRRYRRVAVREVDALYQRWQQHRDASVYLQELNQLLKRAALQAFPAQQVAALSGAKWLAYLDSKLSRPQFDSVATRALVDIYRAHPIPDAASDSASFEPDELRRAAQFWLRRHRC